MPYRFTVRFAMLIAAIAATSLFAAELSMPQNRPAFYTHERIELAVSGLAADETVALRIAAANNAPIELAVTGGPETVILALPPNSLAPGAYTVTLGEKEAATFTVSRGVWPSTMLVSQAGGRDPGGRNFILSNAFNYGVHDTDGQASENPLRRHNMKIYNDVVASDLPTIVYMYWTGYVLHKPWGVHKEWASADMIENMRLFNFHVAQRLRRYDHAIVSIGSLDEPGLPWGRTRAGGSASGFTGWNVADWMQERGATWTDDPGNLPDDQYRRYMQLRALMLREAFQDANRDIKTVWPDAIYATDAYAPQAVGDGTDPMNQIANDIPTTHVFADYGIGKIGVLAGMYLEKAHDPTSKIAHAMNGQLFGFSSNTYHLNQLHAYHLMINVMLAAGLDSNWWLNFSRLGTTPEGKNDAKQLAEFLEQVNGPAARLGPVFHEMAPSEHEVAILWSTTEIWMRTKDIMIQEANKADGEQVALMVADMPEDALNEDGKLTVNAYSIGGNYKGEILTTQMAVNRAGYPSHILHEDRLPEGVLSRYKVLVVVRQTAALPTDKQAAIDAFIEQGGTVLTIAPSPALTVGTAVDAPTIVNQGFQWSSTFGRLKKVESDAALADQLRDASYLQTNHFMEHFSRDAAPIIGAALAKTDAKPVMQTDSVELACERHVGGEGAMLMVINGYEDLPDIAADQVHKIWNYAPYEATVSLPAIPDGSIVHVIEGLDWRQVRRLQDPRAPQSLSFQPGEMKLFLVAPRMPAGLKLQATGAAGVVDLQVTLDGVKMPWPIHVSVTNPAGDVILDIDRATHADGVWRETVPLGLNAPSGDYRVMITSPVGPYEAAATVSHSAVAATPEPITAAARVFDAQPIRDFLAAKPAITIAVGNPDYQAAADTLAEQLKARGIQATVAPESSLWRKSLYPRVWDPYAPVVSPTDSMKELPKVMQRDEKGQVVRGDDKKPVMVPATIERELNITSESYDTPTVTTPDGQPFTGKWQQLGTMLTVVGKGYIDRSGRERFVEPGVKLFVGDRNKVHVMNGSVEEAKTDAAFRQRWAMPWQRLIGHVGGFNLTPQLPEAYRADGHLILIGDSHDGELVRALQASELLMQVVTDSYPGPGKSLVQFAWSPFALEKNVIFIGASDLAGVDAGIAATLELAPAK